MKASQLIRILFLGGFVSFLNAQERGVKMEGEVTDTGHEPLEGVAVLLKSTSDSAYVVGAVTATLGISGLDTSARNAIVQYLRMKDHNGGDWVRIGLEYEINDRFSSELSQTVTRFHKFQMASTFTVLSDVRNQADSLLYTNSFSWVGQRASSGGAQVNYKDEKDRTADFSFDYFVHAHTQKLSMHSEMENTGKQVMNRDTLKGDMKSRIRMYSLQANGSLPLSERFKLDFGTKFTWVDLDNQIGYANQVAGGWLLNSSLSNPISRKLTPAGFVVYRPVSSLVSLPGDSIPDFGDGPCAFFFIQ